MVDDWILVDCGHMWGFLGDGDMLSPYATLCIYICIFTTLD